MKMNILLNFVNRIFLLAFILTFLNSCSGLFRSAPAKDIPINQKDRVAKNIAEGRGIRLFDKKSQGGDFQFASSNPLWRATLDTLDFMPILNASYSGGIIVTDWYGEDNGKDSIKITIKFLSNEIRPDGIDILVYKKNCKSFENCQANRNDGKLSNELKFVILKKATQLKKTDLIKKK
jgi:hypothetical protein